MVTKKPRDVLERTVWGLLTTWQDGQKILFPTAHYTRDGAKELLELARMMPQVKSAKLVRCKITLEKPI